MPKIKLKYQIYNKIDKTMLSYPFTKVTDDKDELISVIRHNLGGNPDLVVVISKASMNEWKERHSEKAKKKAINEAIHWLTIPDEYYDKKTLYSGQTTAAYNLKEVFSSTPEEILYEIDGYSVVYDRTFKKQDYGKRT